MMSYYLWTASSFVEDVLTLLLIGGVAFYLRNHRGVLVALAIAALADLGHLGMLAFGLLVSTLNLYSLPFWPYVQSGISVIYWCIGVAFWSGLAYAAVGGRDAVPADDSDPFASAS